MLRILQNDFTLYNDLVIAPVKFTKGRGEKGCTYTQYKCLYCVITF